MLNIFYYLLISLGINITLFIPAFIFKTDKLTDLSYSLSFIVLILIAFFLVPFSTLGLIITLMVVVWALRLGTFLFVRIGKMKKDKRFDGMREYFFKFLRFWVLQAVAVFVILIPSIFFINSSQSKFCGMGFLIFLIGLIVESVADAQKYKFKQNKKNKGKFIQSGLWKYSRHPNYFGEILVWIGMYVFVFLSLNLTQKLIALVSPLFIIILLLFVSGIPMLEKAADKKWSKDKAYKEYKKKTSVLIPWFTKK
ncbi:MAG: DUF1295 domain-containing protein [archaeon]